MKTRLEASTRKIAQGARVHAREFSGFSANGDLEREVLQLFRAMVLSKLEPDPRIAEAVRDVQVMARAVEQSTSLAADTAADAAREALVGGIDNLERTILRFGIGNGYAGALGNATAGERISDD